MAEFVQSAARAGITCVSIMSAEAAGAMWTDVKLTKWKLQKISAHLLDWFKKPVTAKEPDADSFGTRPRIKRNYDTCELMSEKGKQQSQDDVHEKTTYPCNQLLGCRSIIALEAVEDERRHT